jgi:hypothetical protein
LSEDEFCWPKGLAGEAAQWQISVWPIKQLKEGKEHTITRSLISYVINSSLLVVAWCNNYAPNMLQILTY